MLIRVSRSSPSKTLEGGYVLESAKVHLKGISDLPVAETLRDASSVPNSVTLDCRHAGSGTKRVLGDGASKTFPRGESGKASPLCYRRNPKWRVISKFLGRSGGLVVGQQHPLGT